MNTLREAAQQVLETLEEIDRLVEEQIGRATAAQAALQMTKATHALKLAALERQRDALLEALKEMLSVWDEDPAYGAVHADKARAAIKAAEENA